MLIGGLLLLLCSGVTAKGGSRGSSGARLSSSGSRSSSSSRTSSSSTSFRSGGLSTGSSSFNTGFRTSVFHSSSSTYFSSGYGGTHIILVPSTPIFYSSRPYYWGHTYYPASSGYPLVCEYRIEESDEDFRNVTFSNGTHPQNVVFGCPRGSECCGLDCCQNNTTLYIILSVFVLLLICICSIKCMKGCRFNKRAPTVAFCTPEPVPPIVPVFTIGPEMSVHHVHVVTT
ncbi:unnamed protein product [Caenorhabditis auriculariae]|uniref:CX domain-containing protein n=1 Tax=Caenorhabditis auriculariae TaxID=2777116 RepID=A0A8S1HCR1_9PELO|nr:unnamed protein product [Caenorhabditis auriculariae]